MAITLANTEVIFPNASVQSGAPTGVFGTSMGYIKLPGQGPSATQGLIMAFGYVKTTATSATVTFDWPTLFTEVFQVQLQLVSILGTRTTGGTDTLPTLRNTTLKTTGFQASLPGSSLQDGFFWLVLGK